MVSCVCLQGRYVRKGESWKREGKVLLIFEEKYIYRYEMKTVLYISGMEDPVTCSLIILTIFLKE